jgi:hypothetical protein
VAGCRAGSPGPLEIVTAKVPCYVHGLSDEVEARDAPAFHGSGGELGGGDAPGGDLGLGVAFAASWYDLPLMQTIFRLKERRVVPSGRRVECGPSVCEAVWQNGAQCRPEGCGIAAAGLRAEGSGAVVLRGQVNGDGASRPPIRGDLEDGRSAEAAVREEKLFAKACPAVGCDDLGGETGEVGI